MWLRIILAVLALLTLVLFAVVCVSRIRLDRANEKLVRELLLESNPAPKLFAQADLQGLPEPVQRYLIKAIPEGHPHLAGLLLQRSRRGGADLRRGQIPSEWRRLCANAMDWHLWQLSA